MSLQCTDDCSAHCTSPYRYGHVHVVRCGFDSPRCILCRHTEHIPSPADQSHTFYIPRGVQSYFVQFKFVHKINLVLSSVALSLSLALTWGSYLPWATTTKYSYSHERIVVATLCLFCSFQKHHLMHVETNAQEEKSRQTF